MWKSAKSRAGDRFTATGKKEKRFLEEKEKAWSDVTERVARQRSLRLSKQAADKGGDEDEPAGETEPSEPLPAQRG